MAAREIGPPPKEGLWKQFVRTIATNPISTFAVLLVAGLISFLAYMMVWQTNILSSPDWCNRAMKAEQLQEGSRLDAALACVGLQKIQIEALALDSHINHSGMVMAFVVLIVVVIAGARLAFKLSQTGLEGDMGRDTGQGPKVTTTTTTEVEAPPATPAQAVPAKPAVPPVGDEE